MPRRNQPDTNGFYVDNQGRYHTSGWKPKEHGPLENFKDQFSAWRLSKQTSGVNGFFNTLNSVLDGNALKGIMNRLTGAALTPAEREANEWSASQAELAFNREMEASNTAKQRQVADMQAAGINPMMAVSQGVSLPASASPSSVSPSASAFSMSDLLNMFRMKELLPLEKASLAAQTEKVQSEAAKNRSETTGVDILNDFRAESERLRLEGNRLSNSLTEAQEKQVNKAVEKIADEIVLLKKQADTESERKNLYAAQRLLFSAQRDQLVQLLPYHKALMSAQTERERQAALVAAADAAYRNGLISSGYIAAQVQQAYASASASASAAEESNLRADRQKIENDVAEIRAMFRTGQIPDDSPMNTGVNRFVLNNVLHPIELLLDNFNPLTNVFGSAASVK